MKASLRQDLPASIVVFFVAVPLCLGIALASGAPPFAGLIAGIIGGLVVGMLSGSPLGVSGPAAGLAVIVAQGIKDLGSYEIFLLAVFLSGFVQIGLGLLRAGVLGYFFPSSVIRGMLAGIGILILGKQLPLFMGWQKTEGGKEYSWLDEAVAAGDLSADSSFFETYAVGLQNVNSHALLVAAVSMAILLVWDNVLSKRGGFFKVIQGPLVAVAFGILYQVFVTTSDAELVTVPVLDSADKIMDAIRIPTWSALGNADVWIMAVTIAVVGSLETLLCLDATDKLDPQKRVTPPSRELLAQGVGNSLSGLIGGLPVTQVIVRSSANINARAATKLSAILHGGFLLLAVLLVPGLLNMVPLAALASILIIVGYKLAKPQLFATIYRYGWGQFLPFLTTVLGIVFTDLLKGIGMGIAVAVIVLLRRNFRNSHFLRSEGKDEETGEHRVNIRLSEEVTFLNKGSIIRELSEVPDGSTVVIDRSNCVDIDHDVIEVIDDFQTNAKDRGITVEVVTG